MKYEIVLMNFWNVKPHGASVGDDFDARISILDGFYELLVY